MRVLRYNLYFKKKKKKDPKRNFIGHSRNRLLYSINDERKRYSMKAKHMANGQPLKGINSRCAEKKTCSKAVGLGAKISGERISHADCFRL